MSSVPAQRERHEMARSRCASGSVSAGLRALGEQLGREALSFGDALDLDRDRVDRLLHALEPRRDVGGSWSARRGRARFAARTPARSARRSTVAAMHTNSTIGISSPANSHRLLRLHCGCRSPAARIESRFRRRPCCPRRPSRRARAPSVARSRGRGPVPPGFDVTYGSQMRASCSRGMPQPVSDTATSTESRPVERRSRRTRTPTRPPPRHASTALSMTFDSARASAS